MNYLKKIEDKISDGKMLYIDFDDTLVDFINGWLKNIRHKELSHLKMLPNQSNEVDSFRFFKVDSSGEALASLSNPLVYKDIKVLPYANEFIERINSLFGKDSYKIITTSYDDAIIGTKNKVLKDLFDINTDRIIHSLDKTDIVNGNILIDDAIHNVKPLNEKTLVFMPIKSWNIRYTDKYKINDLSSLL